MIDLVAHVERSILRRRLLRRGQRLLVAVSGGVDSMVLLRILHSLSAKHGWRLTVAHLNHQLRGRSSDADEALVRRAAAELGLPEVLERIPVREFARQKGLSLELAARDRRHDFLARAAADRRILAIALGHHAHDQVELFFLRLLRGAGEGLGGMKWRSRSPKDPRLELVRPLLDVSKEALREFARANKVGFREDRSNVQLDIPRNRLRHELLPLLRKRYQPALEKTVSRTMELARAEAEFVTELARAWVRDVLERSRKPRGKPQSKPTVTDWLGCSFEKLPVAVQRRCIQLQLFQLGVTPAYDLIERLREQPEKFVSVSPVVGKTDAVWLKRALEGRVLLQDAQPQLIGAGEVIFNLAGRSRRVKFDAVSLDWRLRVQKGTSRPQPRRGRELFDASMVGGTVILRHWRPGDRFQPIGMQKAAKLQDLFTNLKVPRAERHKLVVATTAEGEVFWVENLRIGERFKLTRSTIRRLQWMWKRL